MSKYRDITIILLAIYSLCALCPERLFPASAAQASEARNDHDCHSDNQENTRCPTSLVEYLPSPVETALHLRNSQAFVAPHVVAAVFGLSLRVKYFSFAAAGPPTFSLKPILRI